MIRYKCTKCAATLESPKSMAGKEDTCPLCGQVCIVPLRKTTSHVARKTPIYAGAVALVALVSLSLYFLLRDSSSTGDAQRSPVVNGALHATRAEASAERRDTRAPGRDSAPECPVSLVAGEQVRVSGNIVTEIKGGGGVVKDSVAYYRYLCITDDSKNIQYGIWPASPGQLRLLIVPGHEGFDWVEQDYDLRERGSKWVYQYRGGNTTRHEATGWTNPYVSVRAFHSENSPDNFSLAIAGASMTSWMRGPHSQPCSSDSLAPFTGVIAMVENRSQETLQWQLIPVREVWADHEVGRKAIAVRAPLPHLLYSGFLRNMDGEITFNMHPGGYCEVIYLFPGTDSPSSVELRGLGTFVVTHWEPQGKPSLPQNAQPVPKSQSLPSSKAVTERLPSDGLYEAAGDTAGSYVDPIHGFFRVEAPSGWDADVRRDKASLKLAPDGPAKGRVVRRSWVEFKRGKAEISAIARETESGFKEDFEYVLRGLRGAGAAVQRQRFVTIDGVEGGEVVYSMRGLWVVNVKYKKHGLDHSLVLGCPGPDFLANLDAFLSFAHSYRSLHRSPASRHRSP